MEKLQIESSVVAGELYHLPKTGGGFSKEKLPTLHCLTKANLRKMEHLYFQKPKLRIKLKILICQV